MAIYTTTKCGHCEVKWKYLTYGTNSICGSPNVKCRACSGMNLTDQTLLLLLLFLKLLL